MQKPRVIIGLGNPGPEYQFTRHNSGFLVVDALVEKYNESWREKTDQEQAQLTLNSVSVLVIKPQTFMNSSGKIGHSLLKQGILPEEILVVHDELELPFGKRALRCGGSSRGHRGLKSLIEALGSDQFMRLRFGIGRPEIKEHVPSYVLHRFTEDKKQVEEAIIQAVVMIERLY